jgi:hypothetical protein
MERKFLLRLRILRGTSLTNLLNEVREHFEFCAISWPIFVRRREIPSVRTFIIEDPTEGSAIEVILLSLKGFARRI